MNSIVVNLAGFGETILTPEASKVFRKILSEIQKARSGDCVVVDFRGVKMISSKACELVASELIQRHDEGRRVLFEKHLVLIHLTEEVRHTVDMVMKIHNDAVLAYPDSKGPQILGHYPQFLQDTFAFICGRPGVTAHDISDQMKLKINVATERLRRLTDWGFVVRGFRASSRKPVYEYRVLNPFV